MCITLSALRYTLIRMCDKSFVECFKCRKVATTFKSVDGNDFELTVEYIYGNHRISIYPVPYPKQQVEFLTSKQISWNRAHRKYSRMTQPDDYDDAEEFSAYRSVWNVARKVFNSQTAIFDEFISVIHDTVVNMQQIKLCDCLDNLIVDGHETCFECSLRLKPDDLERHFCAICHDDCVAPVQLLPCCENFLHRSCLTRHLRQDSRCPLCRTDTRIDSEVDEPRTQEDFSPWPTEPHIFE